MLLYKNHKLHAHKVCFAVPDNFYLLAVDESDLTSNIEIGAADQSYTVTMGVEDLSEGTEAELLDLITNPEWGMTELSPVTPITIAGFSGHYLIYRSAREEYYELRLALDEEKEFYLYVTSKDQAIDDILASDEMKWILQHIEPSEMNLE